MSDPIKNMSWTLYIPPGSVERFISFGSRRDGQYHCLSWCGGISALTPGYRVARREFYAHELLFPLEGELSLTLEGKRCVASPEEAAFLPCEIAHVYDSEGPLKFLWFHIRPEQLPETETPACFLRPACYVHEIRLLAELLLREERRRPERCAATGDALREYLEAELRGNEREHRYRRQLERCFEQIRRSLHEPWTVAEAAKLACMSEANFFHAVRELYHTTPHNLLRRMRMENASALLLRGDDGLGTIAAKVGYADSFSFSKAFRNYFKCSPRSFRAGRRSAAGPEGGLPPEAGPFGG